MKGKKSQESISDSLYYLRDAKRIHDKMLKMYTDSMGIEKDHDGHGGHGGPEGKDGYKRGIIQWNVLGRQFNPVGEIKVIPQLPSGWYRFGYNGRSYVPELMEYRTDELIKLPMPEYDSVIDDMRRFWQSEQKYRDHNFPYKRGILLMGRPGTGKSGLLRLLAQYLIEEQEGILFNISTPDEIYSFEAVFSAFREIEPNRRVIVMMEDVDNFMRYGGSTQAKLLNILDGNMEYDNVVFLATTNFPHILLESISNRPSRFDRRYEIGAPNEEARRMYISTKFKNLGTAEVDKLVQATKGFVIDQLKETVLSIHVLGYPFEFVIEEMKKLFVNNGRVGDDASRYKTFDNDISLLSLDDRDIFEQELED